MIDSLDARCRVYFYRIIINKNEEAAGQASENASADCQPSAVSHSPATALKELILMAFNIVFSKKEEDEVLRAEFIRIFDQPRAFHSPCYSYSARGLVRSKESEMSAVPQLLASEQARLDRLNKQFRTRGQGTVEGIARGVEQLSFAPGAFTRFRPARGSGVPNEKTVSMVPSRAPG